MLKLFLLTLFTFPLLAQELKLSGPGLARYASGREYPCREIFLDLTIKEDALLLNQGGYICGFLQAAFDSFKMDIRAGELWHQDLYLGQISENEIQYQVYDPSDDSTYFFHLKREGPHYHYFEEWHDGSKIALKIEGSLTKLPQLMEELSVDDQYKRLDHTCLDFFPHQK